MSRKNEQSGSDSDKYLKKLAQELLGAPDSHGLREAAAELSAKEMPAPEVLPTKAADKHNIARAAACIAVAGSLAGAAFVAAKAHLPSNEENARLTSGNPGSIVEVGKKADSPSTAQLGPSVRALILSGSEERTVKIMTTLGICGEELAAQSYYDRLRAKGALTTSAVADYTARADQEGRAAEVLSAANVDCQPDTKNDLKTLVPVSNLGSFSVRRDFITDFNFMSWHDQRQEYLTAQSWATAHQSDEVARDNQRRIAAGDHAFGAPTQQ